jgi:hypothetical protein
MTPLLAYFDPGAGSLLMQALLGGIGGVVVLVRYLCTSVRLRRARGPGSTETSGC